MINDRFSPKLYNKQQLPLDLLEKYIVKMLLEEQERVARNEYRSPGVFDTAWALAAGTGNDKVTITPVTPFMGVDGIGGSIHLQVGDSRITNVKFPNDNGVGYHIALQLARYPGAPTTSPITPFLEVNPQTLQFEYRLYGTTIGRVAHPDSVVDNGATLTLTINDAFINGGAGSFAGRTAKVWLVNPKTVDEAVAVQERTVAFAGNNTITTADLLGQTTPSTTPSDYLVLIVGPTICDDSTRDLSAPLPLTGTTSSSGTGITGVGTFFLSELFPGDVISNGKENRTVLSVASNTVAKVDEAFETPLSGATISVAPGIFIGIVTGNGPTATPVTFDQLLHRVIPYSGSDFAEVLRRDTHGAMKVRVRADASDTDEKQIEVQGSDGTTHFSVDEDGDVLMKSGKAKPDETVTFDTPRSAGLAYPTAQAAVAGYARGHAGDDGPGASVQAGFIAAVGAFLSASAGPRAKYAFAGGADANWTAFLAALSNNIPAVAQSNAAATALISLLKLNASNELEVGSNTPLITQNDQSAAWCLLRAWKTGSNDQLRLYISNKDATLLEACLVLNASWDQAVTSLGNAGWSLIDGAKKGLRLRLTIDTNVSIRVERLQTAGGPHIDSVWSTFFWPGETNTELAGILYSDGLDAGAGDIDTTGNITGDIVRGNTRVEGALLESEGDLQVGTGVTGGAGCSTNLELAKSHFFDDFYGFGLNTYVWTEDGNGAGAASIDGNDPLLGGWVRLTTDTTNGNAVTLNMNKLGWKAGQNITLYCRLLLGQNGGGAYPGAPIGAKVELGFFADPAHTAFGGDGMYIRWDASDSTAWKLVTKDGGDSSVTSTTINVSRDTVEVKLVITGSLVTLYLDGVASAGGTHSGASLYLGKMTFGVRIETQAAAAKVISIDSVSIWQDRSPEAS